MTELQRFLNVRKALRSKVTQTHNTLSTFSILSPVQVESKISFLNETLKDLKQNDSLIWAIEFKEKVEEGKHIKEIQSSLEYNEKIHECLAELGRLKQSTDSNIDQARSLLRSPTAPLPEFSGSDKEDYNRFILSFEDTISKFRYPDYDKFLLLRQQLKGRALLLVNSLEHSKQSFQCAKTLLSEAFASPATQKFNVIQKISDMKLGLKDDPFEYVGKMRMLTESVKDLNLNVNSFLEFFFWRGLNDEFKAQVIQIVNKTEPSLDELNKNFFDAIKRYETILKSKDKIKSEKSVSSFAINVDSRVKKSNAEGHSSGNCVLCESDKSDSKHPIFKCTAYPKAADKVKKLNALKACTKCCRLNHLEGSCRFKLKRKCKCDKWHFSFLCCETKPNKRNEPKHENKTDTKPVETSCSMVIVDAFSNYLSSDTILPTFTGNLNNKIKVRCLKDPCCQSNFIRSDLAEQLNLETVHENVDVKINGFNCSQEYKTRVVKVNIDFGKSFQTVEAICTPEIKICLNLPGLSDIAKTMAVKGYSLADEKLIDSDCISDVGFLLGAKSAYCLKSTEISFGDDCMSIYAQTELGIMLLGDISSMSRDLKFLPNINVSSLLTANDLNFNDHFNPFNKFFETDVEKTNEISDNFAIFDNLNNFSKPLNENLEQTSFLTISDYDQVKPSDLQKSCNEILQTNINSNFEIESEDLTELNRKLLNYVLDNTKRNSEGRLIMPILWRSEVSHLLGSNFELSKSILFSNLKKLKKNPIHLKLMDDSFKDQVDNGVIERIHNIDQFLSDYPNYSFLPHMGVFKLKRETTKCRVVYLSNLCQKDSDKVMTVSHNQAIYDGPCLNPKITTALLHLRFDSKLLIFDIKRAFNQISLGDNDSARLLCLWFNNPSKGDFSLAYYRNVRLPFGLRCSPTILMLGLYYILILNSEEDNDKLRKLKYLLFQLFYMDNGSVSSNSSEELLEYYDLLNPIFNPFQFQLQQFVTNDINVHKKVSPDESELNTNAKILGTRWSCSSDVLSSFPIQLDSKADTKRKVLKTIAAQYDIHNFNGPILNRARMFLHSLQCKPELVWDEVLPAESLKEWRNISKQANASQPIEVPRCVGSRSDPYQLIAFTDTSKDMYGIVIYLLNLFTKKLSFIFAKNRIVNSKLEGKSIPSLELQAVVLGTQCLIETFYDLTGDSCSVPIKVTDLILYCDSLVSLSWLDHDVNKFGKMAKRSVFVQNRIEQIKKLCEKQPVTFKFITGLENPADYISRCVSYKKLIRTNYISGPSVETLINDDTGHLSVKIPNPLVSQVNELSFNVSIQKVSDDNSDFLVSPDKISSFTRLVNIYSKVLLFIHKIKLKIKIKNPAKFSNLDNDLDVKKQAVHHLVKVDQKKSFPEIIQFFNVKGPINKTPNLVTQLNIFRDDQGLLRVKCKLDRNFRPQSSFPLLISKSSKLTELIVRDLHHKCNHAGVYTVLKELRKSFWLTRRYSTAKRILKDCIICRRYNRRTIQLNQSSYKDERLNPSNIPYGYIYIDYLGPFEVKSNGSKVKIWLLILTCMWSRAINLVICHDYSVKEFLRSLQIHIFSWGLPSFIMSDLGSQITCGSNKVLQFLNDPEVLDYLKSNNVEPLRFEQFSKGKSELGGLVESCVKLSKRLIFGSVGKNILSLRDFEFLICQTVHLVNKRPIAFKEGLRDSSGIEFPEPITPEHLTHGRELISLNIIPELQADPDLNDPDWSDVPITSHIKNNFTKLKKVRSRLNDLYHEEFLTNLVCQSTDRKDRYKQTRHDLLSKGDIVLLKEPHTKRLNFPMGIVKEVTINQLGECTDVLVFKGSTKELVKRHVSSIIPLMSVDELNLNSNSVDLNETDSKSKADVPSRPIRKSAEKAKSKIKQMLN